MDGTTYVSYGNTLERPKPFSVAEVADCFDTLPNSPGSVFADEPPTEAVGTFGTFPATEVVGVRLSNKMWQVFTAESMPRSKRDAILATLSIPK